MFSFLEISLFWYLFLMKCFFSYSINSKEAYWCRPRLRCHSEVTSDQTIQVKVSFDQTKVRWKHRVRSKCARSALQTVSDQTFLDARDLWFDQNQTSVQTIVRPWTRPKPDHRTDDCALKITSDQTIVRSKVTPDQTILRSKYPLIRLNCARSSLISEWC